MKSDARNGLWGIVPIFGTAGLISLGMALASPALAQTAGERSGPLTEDSAGPTGLGEIVVTAQRRSENLQKVPISITAVTADALESANVSNISELGLVASSLNFMAEGAWSQPTLRGVGTAATGPGIENAVATYIDGVYQAAMIGGAADFSNIQAVEVINGPQGTLFGRNATGGLVQIRTLDPVHEFGGMVTAGYGNYDTFTAGGYITGGLSDTLAANLAVDFRNQADGYSHDVLRDVDVQKNRTLFIRSKLLFTPGSTAKFILAGNYSKVHFDPLFFNYPGSIPAGGPYPGGLKGRQAASPNPSRGEVEQYGATLTGDIDLGGINLLSITSYQHTDAYNLFGTTITNPFVTNQLELIEPHRQFSQELQFSSPSGGPFTWTAGLFYFQERARYDPVQLTGPLYFPVTSITFHTRARTQAYAAYAQGTYEIAEDTRLTAGLRYSIEKRRIRISNEILGTDPESGATGIPFAALDTSDHRTFKAPTWRLSLDHNFTPDVLAYLSYNRGFKSGGFNPAQIPALAYKPERLDAYEAGLKTQTADRRLRFNISAFLYNYSQIQVQSFANQILKISNGAKARFYGFDAEADAVVTENLRLHAGFSYLHARFTKYDNADLTVPDLVNGGNIYLTTDAKGHRIPRAPDVMANAAINYKVPTNSGDFNFNVNYAYNSGWKAEADGRMEQGAYSLINAQVDWTSPGGTYEIAVWGKNLTDKDYAETIFAQNAYDEIHWAAPRTFGVTFKVNF